jgi:hypothetical protein
MFSNAKKFASLEARLSQIETLTNELKSAQAVIDLQQVTINKLITSQIDYNRLSLEVVENLDYSPLTDAVQEFLSDYDFDYDEIASNLEDSVAERVARDVDWDSVSDDYSKLIDLITEKLDVSDAVETAVDRVVNNDLDFDSAISEWLDSNGEELIANHLDSRAVFDALRTDLDTDETASRDLVETLMRAFVSYNEWRSENGESRIEIGSSSGLDLESLGSQIKAVLETQTVTSEADAVGDYNPLEWQVLMIVRKAVLEILA